MNEKNEFSSNDKKTTAYRKSIENQNVELTKQIEDLKNSLIKTQNEAAELQQDKFDLEKQNIVLKEKQRNSGFKKSLIDLAFVFIGSGLVYFFQINEYKTAAIYLLLTVTIFICIVLYDNFNK